MAFDRPVHAHEAADGGTATAVAAPAALGSVAHGDQTTPPDGKTRLAGGKS